MIGTAHLPRELTSAGTESPVNPLIAACMLACTLLLASACVPPMRHRTPGRPCTVALGSSTSLPPTATVTPSRHRSDAFPYAVGSVLPHNAAAAARPWLQSPRFIYAVAVACRYSCCLCCWFWFGCCRRAAAALPLLLLLMSLLLPWSRRYGLRCWGCCFCVFVVCRVIATFAIGHGSLLPYCLTRRSCIHQ